MQKCPKRTYRYILIRSKIKVGSQWCVRVTFPYEVPQELFSFATEAEAQEWIAARFGHMA